MNLNNANDNFVPIPEPSMNDSSTIRIGMGTIGLGAYVSPLQEAAKHTTMKRYLAESEDKRSVLLDTRARERAAKRRTSYFKAAADERRAAKLAFLEKREQELADALEERQRVHLITVAERERQREQRKELATILAERKQQHRENSKTAKEERRRNYEHEMMERQERQQQERDTVAMERQEQIEINERKAAWRREQAQASKQAAIDSVKEMKQKQLDEAKMRKAQIDKKLAERRAGYQNELHEHIHRIHTQKSNHTHRIMELSNKREVEKLEAVESSKLDNAVPTAAKIKEERERKFETVVKKRADEIRRARSVMW